MHTMSGPDAPGKARAIRAEGRAVEWRCGVRGTARCGGPSDGIPPRKCRECGGWLLVLAGTYGVFVHTGTGRYPLADAVATFDRESKARRHAETDSRFVVRFVSD